MLERVERIIRKDTRLCAGVMSGTSLDGMDVALCEIGGHSQGTRLSLLAFETVPYTPEERERLLAACSPDTGTVQAVCELNKWLGVRIGQAVLAALDRAGRSPRELDFVSSHGQTVFHMPWAGATLQIGELADIAAVTGALAVGDFRPSDMAYGGEGAPLVPFVDFLLCQSSGKGRLMINIGGISNVTALPAGGSLSQVLAFDAGPGNVLADHLMRLHSQGAQAYDKNGETASRGRIREDFLEQMRREDPFLERKPPKSTGREQYTLEYAEALLRRSLTQGMPFEDLMASVTEYTALALAQAADRFVPFAPEEVYASGGGIHNRFLMDRLSRRLGKPIRNTAELGLHPDAKEAVAFALLGNQFLMGRPNNAPAATGADRPVVMGKLALPSPGV